MGSSAVAFRPSPSRQLSSNPASGLEPKMPDLKRLPNGDYCLCKNWTVDLNGQQRIVPVGYSSNGMTAPSCVKISLGDAVQYRETWAAVFHDWLTTQPGISRQRADKMFHDLMIAYKTPHQKAEVMYDTVAAYSLLKIIH